MAEVPGTLVAAGFDAAVAEGLPEESRARLARVASLRLAAFLVIALSVGIAAFISMHGGLAGSAAAVALGTAAWMLWWGMGRLLVSAGGPGIAATAGAAAQGSGAEGASAAADGWRPGILWPLLMAAAGLLAAQPILLALGWGGAERRLEAKVDDLVALNLSRQRDLMLAGDNMLRLQRAQLAERLAMGGIGPAAAATPAGRRKALVIGAQEYAEAGELNNPAKDARDVAAKLSSMGFKVDVSVDEPGEALQLRINRYIASLVPGDISVLVYSGHGYQLDGHNYMVPVDFDGRRRGGIRVTRILEAIDRRSPQLQVIVLDACRSFETDGFRASTGGLAELQGGGNSFIAMAAQPGKAALDGPKGSNGLFIGAMLRHIDRPEDINLLFRRISADVAEAARKRDFVQQPVVTSTLASEYVQLVDPAIATPQAALGIAGTTAQDGTGASAACPAPPGLSPAQQGAMVRDCLRSRIAGIDRVLADWREAGPPVLRANADAYRGSLRGSGLFTERLRDMWAASPALLALLSLLCAAALACGEALNWLHQRDLRAYYALRNRHAVRLLERSHRRSEQEVERRLGAARHPDYAALAPFRTRFGWQGPQAAVPDWAGAAAAPSRSQLAAIDAWLRAVSGQGGATP